MVDLTQKAVASGMETTHFIGSTFGLFCMQPEYLVVAAPLRVNGEVVAGFSLAFSLEGIYRSLRQSQQLMFLFIFVNTAILSFLGIYRVFKLYLQPLSRLAKRAEDYREDEQVLFSVRKEDNELQRLSAALNGLLRRLSAEKEKLRATVESLEAANAELKKEPLTATHTAGPSASPESSLLQRERTLMIRRLLDALPRRQKMAIILLRFEGLSYAEISKVLGCSVSAVESLIFRGMEILKKLLLEEPSS